MSASTFHPQPHIFHAWSLVRCSQAPPWLPMPVELPLIENHSQHRAFSLHFPTGKPARASHIRRILRPLIVFHIDTSPNQNKEGKLVLYFWADFGQVGVRSRASSLHPLLRRVYTLPAIMHQRPRLRNQCRSQPAQCPAGRPQGRGCFSKAAGAFYGHRRLAGAALLTQPQSAYGGAFPARRPARSPPRRRPAACNFPVR